MPVHDEITREKVLGAGTETQWQWQMSSIPPVILSVLTGLVRYTGAFGSPAAEEESTDIMSQVLIVCTCCQFALLLFVVQRHNRGEYAKQNETAATKLQARSMHKRPTWERRSQAVEQPGL